MNTYTIDEVEKHNLLDDAWVIIDKNVSSTTNSLYAFIFFNVSSNLLFIRVLPTFNFLSLTSPFINLKKLSQKLQVIQKNTSKSVLS